MKYDSLIAHDDEKEMVSLSQLLRESINEAVPLFNNGESKACYDSYSHTIDLVLENKMLASSEPGILLESSQRKAAHVVQEKSRYSEAAWVLRRAFDKCLEQSDERLYPGASRSFHVNGKSENSVDVWQDESVRNLSVTEKAHSLSDIYHVLKVSVALGDYKHDGTVYQSTFLAAVAVDLLVKLGISLDRDCATRKLSALLNACLLESPLEAQDDTSEKVFQDGTTLYRFSSLSKIQMALDNLTATQTTRISEHDAVLKLTIQLTLEAETLPTAVPEKVQPTITSEASIQAQTLVKLLAQLEPHLEIKDRKYLLKTYKDCFVGSQAIDAMVKNNLAETRSDAKSKLNEILDTGLCFHVTHDHTFHDKQYFYSFLPASEIRKTLDGHEKNLDQSVAESAAEMVKYAALMERYKVAGSKNFTVSAILNAFYGCDSPEGWDLVDLQNWRNNMKRWGFGRREDQDDDMVNMLSPLVANIDPASWDVGKDPEWTSPNGILAQIAIFDQVSRSAFRGTPKAFAWDEIAIRASKLAIEKGYFESAFKSTLNQFLILLPLEHSESWEDQKLGVSLLLKMLSTVAILDDGLSDYEIVKRLEFSKRLATAFLEHAQVIAKFKRYPHRNRPLMRSTTLEERIWLASDLVPRWAKSQNIEEGKKGNAHIISLPVIPLKRLTKR